jgi:hypothetical protein
MCTACPENSIVLLLVALIVLTSSSSKLDILLPSSRTNITTTSRKLVIAKIKVHSKKQLIVKMSVSCLFARNNVGMLLT